MKTYTVEEIVKAQRADGSIYVGKWDGYKVYGIFFKKEVLIGPFRLILEKDGNASLIIGPKAIEIQDYIDKNK